MKLISTSLIICLFVYCQQDNDKQFYFRSVGWKIAVPDSLLVRDSSIIHKPRLPSMPQPQYDSIVYDEQSPRTQKSKVVEQAIQVVEYPEKMLLDIRISSQWRLGGTSLAASINSVNSKAGWQRNLDSIRTEIGGGFSRDYLPAVRVDSIYSKETVDDKVFDKTVFKVIGKNTVNNMVIYSRYIRGYAFHCAIYYADIRTGEEFISMFLQSKFEE